jgi:energy-coupling factor transporter transmembrane protein EcfT
MTTQPGKTYSVLGVKYSDPMLKQLRDLRDAGGSMIVSPHRYKEKTIQALLSRGAISWKRDSNRYSKAELTDKGWAVIFVL